MLSRIGEIQTPLPASQAMLIGLMAAILVYARILWSIVNHAETVVHEGAHALAGIVTGRRIRSVKIDTDGGGATIMAPDTGFGFGVAASAGYIGSSTAGLIAAGLISVGRIVAVLGLGLLLLAAMLLIVRNFFGLIVILICGALLYLIVSYTTTGVQTVIAYGVTWFLLISGPKVASRVARKPKDVADAGILAGMTFLWPSAWCFLWLVGTIAALVVGGAILIHALLDNLEWGIRVSGSKEGTCPQEAPPSLSQTGLVIRACVWSILVWRTESGAPNLQTLSALARM
jgi:hypothetical protein